MDCPLRNVPVNLSKENCARTSKANEKIFKKSNLSKKFKNSMIIKIQIAGNPITYTKADLEPFDDKLFHENNSR